MLNRPEHGYSIDAQIDATLLNINGISVLVHPDILRHLANDLAAAASVYRTPGHQWGQLNDTEKLSAFGARFKGWVDQVRQPPVRRTGGLLQQQNPHPLSFAHLPQTPPFSVPTIPVAAETMEHPRGDQVLSLEEVFQDDLSDE